MKLKSLKVQNWRKHNDLSVSFDHGSNIITGPNYSGKSSLFMAITYALFGANAVAGSAKECRRDGEYDYSVTLVLDNGVSINRTPTSAIVKDSNGEILAASHSAVTRHVESMLGMDRKLFMQVCTSMQGEPQALLNMPTSELRLLLERLAGVDEIDFILDTIKAKVAELGSPALKSMYASYRDVVESPRLEQCRKELETIKVRKRLAKSAKEEYECELAEIDTAVRSLQDEKAKHVMTYNRYSDFSSRVKELSDSPLHEVTEEYVNSQEEELSLLRKRVEELKSATSKASSSSEYYKAIKSKYDSLEVPLNVEITQASLEKLILEYQEALNSCKIGLAKTVEDIEACQKGVCRSCNRPLDGGLSKEEIDTKIQDLKKTEHSLRESIKNRESQYLSYKAELQKLNSLMLERSRIYSDLVSSEVREKEDRAILESVIERYGDLGDLSNKLEHAEKNFKEARKDRQEYLIKCSALNELTLVTNSTPTEYRSPWNRDDLLVELDGVRSEIDERLQGARDVVTSLIAEESALAKELTILEDNYDKARIKIEELEALFTRVNDLIRLRDHLKQNRDSYFTHIWSAFSATTSDFVRNTTDGYVTSVSTEAYVENGRTMPLSLASGAQKSLIGLGMKLALRELFCKKAGFILLDEITADMSDELSAVTVASLPANLQKLIISHRAYDSTVGHVIELGSNI